MTIQEIDNAIAIFEVVRTQFNAHATVKIQDWTKAFQVLFNREVKSAGCGSCVQRDLKNMAKKVEELKLLRAATLHLMAQDNPTLMPNGNIIVQSNVEPGASGEPTNKPKRKRK